MDDWADKRRTMVERQIAGRGVGDERVLDAMRSVPREAFVGAEMRPYATDDGPLPIGEGQTISQPYIVALMVEALGLEPEDRVLEVGAGSGYAAAVLASVAGRVFAIERHEALASEAKARLEELGFANVTLRAGDGTAGWPEEAPFDAILVSAGGAVPPALKNQLALGGRLVIPVGEGRVQRLTRIIRAGDEDWREEDLGAVMFVPLVGRAGLDQVGVNSD